MPKDDIAFPGRLTIDLGAVRENWRRLAEKGSAECAAVVKADAYGLGAAELAPALAAAGCREFFVAFLEEAAALRAVLGPDPRIHVMCASPWDPPDDYARDDLIPVVSTPGHARTLLSESDRPLMLQVETGMNRLGLAMEDLAQLIADPRLEGRLVGIMSHLACADAPAHRLNRHQLDRFREAVDLMRKTHPHASASLANSAGIFLGRDWHCDLLRPGAALYGINPTPTAANPMRPVVTVETPVLQLKTVPAGETVGYGATFRRDGPARIAIVAAGYADGLHRMLAPEGYGLIAGHRAPYAGRVSMDLIALDVTEIPEEALAQAPVVTLIGADLPIDTVADAAGTIGYEILTHLGRRLKRHYIGLS